MCFWLQITSNLSFYPGQDQKIGALIWLVVETERYQTYSNWSNLMNGLRHWAEVKKKNVKQLDFRQNFCSTHLKIYQDAQAEMKRVIGAWFFSPIWIHALWST